MDNLNRWLTLLANTGVLVGIIFLAIEIRQNTDNLEMNRKIALADAYSTRNITVQGAQIEAAMSEDFADIYVKWQQSGSTALSDAERFRVVNWEVARMFRLESQYIMWEKGLLPDDFIETLREVIYRNVQGWHDLGITRIPIPNGGFRDEVNRALAEIDLSERGEAEGT